MKILRIVSELDFGGVEQVLAISVPYLIHTKGYEVLVVVLGKGGRISEGLVQNGFSIFVLDHKTRIPNIKLVFRLKNLIENEKPDVVHCQGSEANFHGLWAAKIAGVKIKIGEEIGLPNHHSYWKLVFKWVYQKADRVIAISEAVKNCIVELGEVEREKVRVVYNPVEIRKGVFPCRIEKGFDHVTNEMTCRQSEVSYTKGEMKKPFIFISICRLVPIKNLERLIEAFSRLQKNDVKNHVVLWIVGDGPLKKSLMQLANRLEIHESVKFFGFQENVFHYLQQANVFVLPSLREGSSVSLAEAMSYGLPSIVTKIGGAIEILGESQPGFLVNPFNTDSIFSAMLDMLNLSEEERKKMGENAKVSSNRFSVKTYIGNLIEVYKG
ncbi:glycosyltransferase [Pararhodonellum marinum]|uniref:glycosyltransferase n=1 Tax=Pararhodonellum marinum TaxID=2755358 RepID=UPI00188ED979|nr:glycosyltransferase [Pararhodonellum marinum]